jgi:glycosyltransferase involved in cell wall biosynthesis
VIDAITPERVLSTRILVVDNALAVTGGINAIRHATGPLRDYHGLQFTYVLPTGSTARPMLEANGYVVHELPFIEINRRKTHLLRYLPYLLLNGWRLYCLAQREGAAIIHINDFYNLTGYVAKLLSFGRLRVVTHVRFLPQNLPQPLARTWRWLASVGATCTVCVSQAVGQYFKNIPRVQVIYDPLPGAEQHPVPMHLPHPDGTIKLLYLSNYIQGKGQDLALEAFRQAYAQNSLLRLRFVGGDMGLTKNQKFRQQLEAEAAQYGLREVIIFDDFASDVEQTIKTADILLNFSESESFSLTCLDALFYGTPLIASDCGGPAELFENGRSGLLVPNRDVNAMANAINRLATDIKLRAQFSAAGRQFVRQKFAPSHTYENLAKLYQNLLKSKAE